MSKRAIGVCLAALLVSSLARADEPDSAAPKDVAAPAKASSATSVEIAGDLPQTGALTVADLEALGPESAKWTLHGKTYAVVGVPLWKVLDKFGFSAGPMSKAMKPSEKRAGWKKVLVATARDGFQAVFSCAELFPTLGRTRPLLVFKMDGVPLPADTGPMRIAVLSDKEPSRSVFAVGKLQIYDLGSAKP